MLASWLRARLQPDLKTRLERWSAALRTDVTQQREPSLDRAVPWHREALDTPLPENAVAGDLGLIDSELQPSATIPPLMTFTVSAAPFIAKVHGVPEDCDQPLVAGEEEPIAAAGVVLRDSDAAVQPADRVRPGTYVLPGVVPPAEWCAIESVTIRDVDYFVGWEPGTGHALWKTVASETSLVRAFSGSNELTMPSGDSHARPLWCGDAPIHDVVALGGTLYFAASDLDQGNGIWTSDGSAAGTTLVKRIDDAGPGVLGQLVVVGGTLFFTFIRGDGVTELWATNGAAAGTTRLREFRHTIAPPHEQTWRLPAAANLTDVDGTLYFAGDDGTNSTELWRSDGTDVGTMLVREQKPSRANVIDQGPLAPDVTSQPPECSWQIRWTEPTAFDCAGFMPIIERSPFAANVDHVRMPAAVGIITLDCDEMFGAAAGEPARPVDAMTTPMLGGPSQPVQASLVADAIVLAETTTVHRDIAAPLLEGHGTALEISEGQKFNRVLASFRDPSGFDANVPMAARIAWGDGAVSNGTVIHDGPRARVAGEHTYAQYGNYSVEVTLHVAGGTSGAAHSTVAVYDAALQADRTFFRTTAGRPFHGPVAAFRDMNAYSERTDFTAQINWGDGTVTLGTIEVGDNGAYHVMGAHVFGGVGSFAVHVRVVSAGGSTATTQSIAKVHEAHMVARGLTSACPSFVDAPRALAAFTDSDRNAQPDWFSCEIDWGDETTAGTVEADGHGGFRVIGRRRLGRAGIHSVRVVIRDQAGNSATAIGTVRVIAAA